VFRYGEPKDYLLQLIGILSAVASGIALAMVNVVLGRFLSLLSDFTTGTSASSQQGFMAAVQKTA
jgi:ATP-binding cassette subfamily B (MDR/TAP) protein 1